MDRLFFSKFQALRWGMWRLGLPLETNKSGWISPHRCGEAGLSSAAGDSVKC